MKLKPKPIIKKAYEEVDTLNEKVTCVPTFPNLERTPSAYKLLEKQNIKEEDKIQSIQEISSLIKQLDKKDIQSSRGNKKKTHVLSHPMRFGQAHKTKKLHFSSNKLTYEMLQNNMNTASTEEATIGKTNNVLPVIRDSKPISRVLSETDIDSNEFDIDLYYAALCDDDTLGRRLKTFTMDIGYKDDDYKKKISGLIFDNKIMNRRHAPTNLQFSQMKQDHFQLFENMKPFKGTTTFGRNSHIRQQPIKSINEKDIHEVTLQKAYLVPLDKLDDYKLLIINNYISQIDFSCSDTTKRKMFIIVDGTVIINSDFIPGFCLEMPTKHYFLKLSIEAREKYYHHFLRICQGKFNSKCRFKNIIDKRMKLIIDLAEIEEDDKFIFISSSNSYQGISLPLSKDIMQHYGKNYKQWKRKAAEENNSSDDDYKADNNGDNVYQIYFDRNGKNCNDKKYLQFQKLHKMYKETEGAYLPKSSMKKKKNKRKGSFSFGKEDIPQYRNDYYYYSDNEKRFKKVKEFIIKTMPTKAAFFIYIHNNIYDKKLETIRNKFTANKEKLKFNQTHNEENNYCKTSANELAMTKHLKRIKQAKEFQMAKVGGVLTTQELCDGLLLIKHEHPDLKLDNFYKEYKGYHNKYPKVEKNIAKCTNPYFKNETKVQSNFPHLMSFNIPHILSLNGYFTKHQLYYLFTQFKSLISLWLALHKKVPISVFGIDFEMFKKCLPQLRKEDDELLKKIFKQINVSSSTLLTLDEFITGLSMLNRQDTKDKIDFFIEVFDTDHKGSFTYEQVMNITEVAIKRMFTDKENENNPIVLKQLKIYFTNLIFQLVDCKTEEGLNIDKLKEVVQNKQINSEYLEIFCCATKI